MEKEGAEKATTELDNSVTSKEDTSLAEKKEKNNGLKADGNDEDLPDNVDLEGDNKDSSKASIAINPELEAAESNEEKPDDTPAADNTPAPEQKPLAPEAETLDSSPGEKSDSGTAKQPNNPEGSKTKEDASEAKEQPKSEDAYIEDKFPNEKLDSDTPEKTEKPEKSNKKEDAPEPQELPKSDEPALNDEQPKEKVDSTAVEQIEMPEVKEASKGEGKEAAKKEFTNKNKPVEEHPDGAKHHDEYQNADFTTYSKEELVEVIKNLGKNENPFFADRILRVIAPLFNQIRAQERKTALKNFIAEGGVEDDFQYNPDELSLRFDANYKLIKDKKTKKSKEQDLQRSKNLILAEEVLSELRNFVDSEESSGSFNSFKTIQQKWKALGDVPSQNSRTLWANYNALIHRFYDQRSIYFELKELDRKKNYESKLILCEKAEALVSVENLREAIKGLNDLHHEFKHIGPVPHEVQEELWQQFKASSDKVYDRRKAFVHELKAELHENQVKKEELIEKIKLFIDFQSDRIKEWNEKTKELIALQNAWEKIGGLPKDKAKQLNKEFWSSFKMFFSHKHLFFKKLDSERDAHLIEKQELLAQANALKDSEDWDKTANELKKLQGQWREIGPVPEKMRKKLYDEFKACCDHFFEKRRVGFKNSNEDYKQNLKKKKEIIGDIGKLKEDADENLDKFNELRKEFLGLGFIPKKNITAIKEEFQRAVEDFLNDLTVLNVKQKTEISLEAEFANLASAEHSETELYHKEQSVRRQINKLEDDIALWQNNLEFFAHSKSTDKLREEVNKKIDDASVHVDSLKRQLKMLRTL